VYLVMGIVAVFAVLLASRLPAEAHAMDEEDAD
jgi:hypothetical protein